MSVENKIPCGVCNDGKRVIILAEPNRDFLVARAEDGKLDLAITYSRIAWETCSNLKKSVDTNSIVDELLKGLQKMFNEQIRNPIGTITTSLSALMTTLRSLTEQNPKLIEQCSQREIDSIKDQINLLEGAISEPTKQINLVINMLSELMHKPNTKGNVGEKILADVWPQYFEHDDVN